MISKFLKFFHNKIEDEEIKQTADNYINWLWSHRDLRLLDINFIKQKLYEDINEMLD